MASLNKIVVLNKEKLLVFSDSQNYFMSLKTKKLQTLEFFTKLSPSECVISFPPCPGVFKNNLLVVYKDNKIILVDLLESAERQKLHMQSLRVKFSHLESQSVADSVTERSDSDSSKFLVPLSGCEFALVFEEAVKIFVISDFDVKCVKEYNEMIPDSISAISYYHTKGNLTHMAVGSETSNQLCLYNIKTDVIDKTFDVSNEVITSVFEIGKYIAATTMDGHLAVWDKTTYIQILEEQIMKAIYTVFKIPNTELFAVGGQGPLIIYDSLDQAVQVKVKDMSGGIVDIAYNEAQSLLIFGDEEGTLYTYSIEKILDR